MPNVIIGSPGIRNGTMEVDYTADPKVGTRKTGKLELTIAAESTSTDESSILATSGMPVLYGFYSGMWCKKITLKDAGPGQHPDSGVATRFWIASCGFDSELDTNSLEVNPLLRPVVISRDSVIVDERLFFDAITGQPIATVNGEPIYVTGPYVMPVFTFTRFEPYPYPDAQILNLTNAINANPFRGAPVGTVLMLKVRTNEVTVKNVRYEQVSYTAQFRIDRYNPGKPYTWREFIPHQGTIWKSSIDGTYYGWDRDGVARGTVHNLNADGTFKDLGLPPDLLPVNRLRLAAFPLF
jgi:hypothetical protein